MYSDSASQKAKIGKVNIDRNANQYRLRFTYPKGKRNQIRVDCTWEEALRVANIIDGDIQTDNIDLTYARYTNCHKQLQQLELIKRKRKPNLVQLFNDYKAVSSDRVAKTTQKTTWSRWERVYLGQTDPELLEIDKAAEFVAYLLTRFTPGSLDSVFSNCLMPSVNLGVKKSKLDNNPYAAIPLNKKPKRKIKAFEPEEVKEIIKAFESDKYVKKCSSFKHSYYTNLVSFIAYTGCRPSEAHALTVEDIKTKGGKRYIRFNKAYSFGILVPATKTLETRLFPVNEQLGKVIDSQMSKVSSLLFPAVKGGYINQLTFQRRNFKVVIEGLYEDKLIGNKLTTYDLRASFITRCIRQGFDLITVAALVGSSPETLSKYYIAAKQPGHILPEL